LPRLFLRILRQRPLRFAKGLAESLVNLALAATGGFAIPASGTGSTGGTPPGPSREVGLGWFFFVLSKPSTFGKVSETRIGSFVSGKITRASSRAFGNLDT
jgi:hypothetical protein